MKIVIAGDWHGCTDHAVAVVNAAHEKGINTILHVGDLGVFWPKWDVNTNLGYTPQRGRGFTGELCRAVAETGVEFRFLDGNHDNHDFLDEIRDGSHEAVEIDGLIYQPRGSRLKLGGRALGFFGGAGSIDKHMRLVGRDWWAQEQITEEDVVALGDAPLDVLLAHEVPDGVTVTSGLVLPADLELEMGISRLRLRRAVEATRPRLVFSGHWHQRRSEPLHPGESEDPARCEVLDRERAPGNAVVLDTDDLSVVPFTV